MAAVVAAVLEAVASAEAALAAVASMAAVSGPDPILVGAGGGTDPIIMAGAALVAY